MSSFRFTHGLTLSFTNVPHRKNSLYSNSFEKVMIVCGLAQRLRFTGGTSSDTPVDIDVVSSRFVGPINSAVVMTADGTAGSPLAEKLVVTVGFGPIGSVVMIADGPVSSPLAERLVSTVVTVCFRHRWCLLTTVFLVSMLSASRFASKVCYIIKYDVNISYEHMIYTYYMNMPDV